MTTPFFGFVINEDDTDAPSPVIADLSIVGLVLPSQDANPAVFPLNTPVSVNSGDPTVLAAMGTGPLYQAVQRINAQLADLESSAQCVIVRVPMAFQPDGETENVAGTIANIVGDPAAGTGLYALLKAPQLCNITPRLIGAPGYTGQTTFAVTNLALSEQGANFTAPVVTFSPAGATATATVGNAGVQAVAHAVEAGGEVTGVAIDNGGQDYVVAPTVTFAGGGGTGAAAHAVIANGIVTAIVMDNEGAGYTSAPNVTLSPPAGGEIVTLSLTSPGNYAPGVSVTVAITDANGGQGAGAAATFTMEQLANPICAALPPVLKSLLGHAIVNGPSGTKQDALNWRTTLSGSGRLIPVDNSDIVAIGQGTAYVDAAARDLGLAVRTDFQHGGYPFFSWANTPVQGALGLKRIDSFSTLDGATDGQELLTAGVGITARGDASDTSLDPSGYISVSLNNDNSDPNLNFYNKTRGRDFIDLTLIRTIRTMLGRQNITRFSVQSVLTAMAQIMVDLQNKGCVIGYSVGFNASDNTTAGLRSGKFTVYDNSEEPAPICQITINRALDQAALTAELASLAATTAANVS